MAGEEEIFGKYSGIEQAILKWLYEHPKFEPGTAHLFQNLRSEFDTNDTKAWEEVLYGVETLEIL